MPLILAEILRSPKKHDASLDWLGPVANWGGLIFAVICLIPCIKAAWRKEQLFAGTLIGWVGIIIWSVVMCFLAPLIALKITGKTQVFRYFPEMPGIIACGMTGWMSSGLLSLMIWIIRWIWRLLLKVRTGSINTLP